MQTKGSAEQHIWHADPAQQVMDRLKVTEAGLDAEQAAERLRTHGPNRLTPPKRRGPLLRLLAQFHNLLIYILIAAAAVTAALGHWIDTAVILGVVVVNSVIGFVQEGRAEKALEAIRNMLTPRASVLRDGRTVQIPAEEVVPGDVVLLASGDKVPADLRLFRIKSLKVDEATLTGESVPVDKADAAVAKDTALGDRTCMAYAGTLVTYGQGAGVVVATGDETEIGRISQLLGSVTQLTTPLLRQMGVFARWLTGAIVVLAGTTFAFGLWARDYTATEMFMAAVGLAVAAIPEGLPAIMTVTLAIGVQRMAGRNAIIRRLPAVETLGSVSVICSDKTGTLTRNEMTVQSVVTAEAQYSVGGVGYGPHGAISLGEAEVEAEEHAELLQLARAGLLCNDAEVIQKEDDWQLHGDPTEGALVTLALKAGLDQRSEREAYPRTDVIPFESEHRFMATLHHDHEGHAFIVVKGAPERVLQMCAAERVGDEDRPLNAEQWRQNAQAVAGRGQRLLAVARRPVPVEQRELRFSDVEQEFTLLGLFGIADPPREEAVEAVKRCQAAGIRVKMITGDHAATARAIGAQLGIGDGERSLEGTELEGLSDEELRRLAGEVDVFARASPEHKLRLVQALQAEGHVVAMTGDGVNDAPALKRADVGVAMGQKGTEVAKEAAEMVLADDNFASIANAVREGRTVYDNLRKCITFLLPVNGGESMSLIAAIVAGAMLPITPLHILWVNMVSSVALAMALAFEPTEPDVMERPPRRMDEPVLSKFLVWRIVLVSFLFLVGIFGMFEWALARGYELEEARTIAVNTLVCMEVFYLFSVRYLRTPSLTLEGLLGTRAVLIALAVVVVLQLMFTYAPFMHAFFDTRPMDLLAVAIIVAVGVALLLLLEMEKGLRRRLGWTTQGRAQRARERERAGG